MVPDSVMETYEFDLNCKVVAYGTADTNLWKTCEWKNDKDGRSCVQKAVDNYRVKEGTCHKSMKAYVNSRTTFIRHIL